MEDTRKFWTKERGASLFLLVIILIFIGNSLFNRISNQILSLLVTQLLILVPAIIYMLILKVNPFQFIRFRRFHLGSAFLIPLLVICLVPVISLVNAFTMLFTTPTIGNAVSDIVSGNLGIGLEPVDVHPRLHQHILHHIVGVVVIEHKVSYLPIQHLAILADDEPECLALGLGRREHLQKCVVVDCHR